MTAPVRPAALGLRERQVLDGMARGLSNSGIGRELELSVDTIGTYRRRLFAALGVHDRAAAVRVGRRLGLVGGPCVTCGRGGEPT